MRFAQRSAPVTLIALLAFAAPSPAKTMQASCSGTKSASFLFWPKGHDARPGAGFPKFKTPHLEVYAGKHSTKFPNNAIRAYLDSKGTASVAKSCTTKSASFAPARVGKARTTAAYFVCAVASPLVFRLGKISGGSRLQALLGEEVVIDLRITASGSKAVFNPAACAAKAPPG
jgi:hypothetical protein